MKKTTEADNNYCIAIGNEVINTTPYTIIISANSFGRRDKITKREYHLIYDCLRALEELGYLKTPKNKNKNKL